MGVPNEKDKWCAVVPMRKISDVLLRCTNNVMMCFFGLSVIVQVHKDLGGQVSDGFEFPRSAESPLYVLPSPWFDRRILQSYWLIFRNRLQQNRDYILLMGVFCYGWKYKQAFAPQAIDHKRTLLKLSKEERSQVFQVSGMPHGTVNIFHHLF